MVMAPEQDTLTDTSDRQSPVEKSDSGFDIRGLSAWYGSHHALGPVTIQFLARQVTALIGPSGCGKSTLIRCLNRMNDLVMSARIEGEILFQGKTYSRRTSIQSSCVAESVWFFRSRIRSQNRSMRMWRLALESTAIGAI